MTICADHSYPLPDNGSVGSAEDGPTYVLEHLATFRVSPESDLVYPADGMRRLLHMEKTSGIWTQKMMLRLDKKWVCIQSHENGVSFWYVQFFPTFEKAISMSAVHTHYCIMSLMCSIWMNPCVIWVILMDENKDEIDAMKCNIFRIAQYSV